jgi:uncharacterized protein DUF6869
VRHTAGMSPEDDEPDMDPLLEAVIMDRAEPNELLEDILRALHAADDPERIVGSVGAGPLETLIEHHGEALWPEIERLARADPVFRRSLRSVWAYDSPEFERRDQLLRELGEHWPVAVRFVVQPEDFLPEPRVSWRAIEVEGEVPADQLSRLLREIADWYDHERSRTNRRYVDTMGNQWPIYFQWREAQSILERAWHRVVLADNAAAFRSAKEAVEAAHHNEHEAWRAFVLAMGYRQTDRT